MREILFRGKKLKVSVFDETDWVYGSLIDSGNHEQVAIYPWINGASTMSVRQLVYARMESVNSETVGQYTGLTDKNGKKIFEGDVVNVNTNKDTLCHRYDGRHLVIRFDEYHRFVASGRLEYPLCNHYEWEVIGNIHDNPNC